MSNKYLIVIDMQNDFVSGSLGSDDAKSIISNVRNKVLNFDGEIIFTRDTHNNEYLNSQEGRLLPVEHCIKGTAGWDIIPEISNSIDLNEFKIYDKGQFGSSELAEDLKNKNKINKIESIDIVGLCTDICVINNAMLLKTFLPETLIKVDAKCCAGTSIDMHKKALDAMKSCQIIIENDI